MFSKIFPARLPSTWRLGILQGVLLIGIVVLYTVVISWQLRHGLSRIAAAVVLDDLGEYAVIYRRHGLQEMKEVFAAGKHEAEQGVRVTDATGAVIFEQVPEALRGFAWPRLAPPELTPGQPVLKTADHPLHDRQLLVGCQALGDGKVLWFGRNDTEDRAYVARIRANLWLTSAAALALALLPVAWFTGQVLSPLIQMIGSAHRLAQGSTDARLTAPAAVPELQVFAGAFNRGLDRAAALTSELEAANDQLAHELRTPLARIRGNLEAQHDHTDNTLAREAAARALEEIDRATQLVQTILTTRAGEHKALKLHLEEVDIREMVEALCDLYQPAAEERRLRLVLEAPETRFVLLDRQRMLQALANLLDNALAYTPAGGRVTLGIACSPVTVRFVVSDTGPGVRPHELERIWQRHARGSAASARTPGMGLGLSLVRAIATAHNGTAGCRNGDDGGAEFWIELPVGDPLAAANAV